MNNKLGINRSKAAALLESDSYGAPFVEIVRLNEKLERLPDSFFATIADRLNRNSDNLSPEQIVRLALTQSQVSLPETLIEYLVADMPETHPAKILPRDIRVDKKMIQRALAGTPPDEFRALMAHIGAIKPSQARDFGRRTLSENALFSYTKLLLRKLGDRELSISEIEEKIRGILYPKYADRNWQQKFHITKRDLYARRITRHIALYMNCLELGSLSSLNPIDVKTHFHNRLIGRVNALRLNLAAEKLEVFPQQANKPREAVVSETNDVEPPPKLSKAERRAINSANYQAAKAEKLLAEKIMREAGLYGAGGQQLVFNGGGKPKLTTEPVAPVAPIVRFVRWNREKLLEELRAHCISEYHFEELVSWLNSKDYANDRKAAASLMQQLLETGDPIVLGHAKAQRMTGFEISELRVHAGFSPLRVFFGTKNRQIYFISGANKRNNFERDKTRANDDWEALSDDLPAIETNEDSVVPLVR